MLRYSVLKYIEKASRLNNLAVRGNSEIYRVEEKLRISMSIHFRRGKEANRLACKPDVMRFRLGQSDKATCDEKKKRTLKKKKCMWEPSSRPLHTGPKKLRSNGV